MKSFQRLLSKLERTDGFYARRISETTAISGGLSAVVELVGFRNVGDEQRPIIVSDEPLAEQTISTHVPNRPPEMTQYQRKHGQQVITLDVQVLTSRIVRIKLGDPGDIAQPRDFGMLLPGVSDKWEQLPKPSTLATVDEVTATVNGFTIHIGCDPFMLSITCDGVPTAFATANDDRNVHGLLCSPPPGLWMKDDRQEVFWSWMLAPDEHLYGLGEHFNTFDQRGKNVTLWTLDAWGTTTDASYKCVPFLLSSQHYGLFFHTPAPVALRLGTSSTRTAVAQVGETNLDLFVIFGETPKAILNEYTRLTGRTTVPPRWAFGVWLSRCRYNSRAEVESIAMRARAENIPCDVLHIDPAWLKYPDLSCDFVPNPAAFPDLAGMVHMLGEQGFKISLWELPYVSAQSEHYVEGVEAGYFLLDEDGKPICADFGTPPADGYNRAIVDFTNPAARAWWQDLHRPWLRAGVAVFKTDFGEGVPLEAHASNGMPGRMLHNLFPLLYNAAVHEVITQETGRLGMVWGRSAWAGSQRYPAQWGGDPKTDVWSMRSSLRGGLNLAMSAPGLWAHDIGGFYGPPPSPELYIRWAQFGLLSPLARAHGTTPREPWEFGDEALNIFRRYATLRMRLNPYLYNIAWDMHEQGWPMLRPLALEFPQDVGAACVDDCYMLGPDILVAPIFSESRRQVERAHYLPACDWFDFWTDERVDGGRYITRTVELDTIPVYVRAGAIIPLGPECSHIGDEVPEALTLEVYIGAEGSSRMIWNADGQATYLSLQRIADLWQLSVAGEHQATWLVRWHTGTTVVESELGYTANATVVLDPMDLM
jgi:alpha-D-xyloside xylohydrolase